MALRCPRPGPALPALPALPSPGPCPLTNSNADKIVLAIGPSAHRQPSFPSFPCSSGGLSRDHELLLRPRRLHPAGPVAPLPDPLSVYDQNRELDGGGQRRGEHLPQHVADLPLQGRARDVRRRQRSRDAGGERDRLELVHFKVLREQDRRRNTEVLPTFKKLLALISGAFRSYASGRPRGERDERRRRSGEVRTRSFPVRLVRLVICSSIGRAMRLLRLIWRF